MEMGMKVSAAGSVVLEGDHSTEGQLPGHGGVVQEVSLQGRLEAGTKMAITIATELKGEKGRRKLREPTHLPLIFVRCGREQKKAKVCQISTNLFCDPYLL